MRRIKVVSEPTDLVPILRAFDTDVKRDVFRLIVDDWYPLSTIESKFGAEGVEALQFFEKTKLVETQWQVVNGKTEKAYRSYYTSFQIGISCAANEMSEILAVASMPEARFLEIEREIDAMVPPEGFSARTLTEKMSIPLVRLRALLKRSTRLEFKGHLVKRMGP